MVVVGILAGVTGIAVVKYKDYSTRAGITNAASYGQTVKDKIMLYYANNDTFPPSTTKPSSSAQNSDLNVININNQKYIANISFVNAVTDGVSGLPANIISQIGDTSTIQGYIELDLPKQYQSSTATPAQLYLVASLINVARGNRESDSEVALNQSQSSSRAPQVYLLVASSTAAGGSSSEVVWNQYSVGISTAYQPQGYAISCPGNQVSTASGGCQCPASSYQQGGYCLPCPTNATCSSTGFNCNAGYGYSVGNCTQCLAGYFSAGGTSSCNACPANQYSLAGASTCSACTSRPGVASCNSAGQATLCTAGYGLSGGVCSQCSAGSFSNGSTECTPCAAGTYSAVGATSCTSCAAGRYSAAGATSCTSCAAGTYSAVGATSCTSCAAGTYSGTGATSCTSCAAGTYSAVGATSCTSCAAGTYSTAGATSCASCSLGAGAISCSSTTGQTTSCAGGWGLSGGTCNQCSAGSFSNGTTACTSCAAGTYSAVGATSCTSCPAGRYSAAGATSCTSCAAGTYSAAGASSCTPCPANTFSASAGSSSCTACGPGMVSTGGASSCTTQCSASQYYNGTSCVACPGNCLTCTSASNCTSCKTSYYGTTCQSVCPGGVTGGMTYVGACTNTGYDSAGYPGGCDQVSGDTYCTTTSGLDQVVPTSGATCCACTGVTGSTYYNYWGGSYCVDGSGNGQYGQVSCPAGSSATGGGSDTGVSGCKCNAPNIYWDGTKCTTCPNGYTAFGNECWFRCSAATGCMCNCGLVIISGGYSWCNWTVHPVCVVPDGFPAGSRVYHCHAVSCNWCTYGPNC